METVVNKYRVCVKKWCGSCEHREVDEEGTRICRKMQLVVQQKCEMQEGAGEQSDTKTPKR